MENSNRTEFTIFGGTGDLAKNKLIPALFDLKLKKCLPEEYKIIGFARKSLSDNEYRDFVSESIKSKGNNYNSDDVAEFLNRIHYVQGDINDFKTYRHLPGASDQLDIQKQICSNKIFYLAVPPSLYEPVFVNLEKSGLAKESTGESGESWTRILVEKPFGDNPAQAQKLDRMLGQLFQENQVFRIDHYLAKEVLQNIIAFRFSNPIFVPVWNRKHIEKIEISLFEMNDASERGHFYDPIGALLDVGQNHILQMLALVTMEDPKNLSHNEIRKARASVIKKMVPYCKDPRSYAFRAQYEGYLNEPGVSKESETDTFFQLKLGINNKRWKGVPIYLQSGKALSKKLVQIKITFKPSKSSICPVNDMCHYGNTVIIDVQPEEKISIKFWSKNPGLSFGLEKRDLSFSYEEDSHLLSDAYEKVLYDCILGDQTLFNSTTEALSQWKLISRVRQNWIKNKLEIYEKGIDPEELLKLK